MTKESDEIILLEGIRQNHRGAIETVYKLHYMMVQQLVTTNNGTVDDAKDVFQEALIVLYERLKKGDFNLNCLLKTYIYAVSKRIWLKKLHQQSKITSAGEELEVLPAVEDDLQYQQQQQLYHQRMQQALLELGEPCKSLIEAFYIQRKSMQDIADQFGYTNSDNAKNQKYKCLNRLKKLFFKANKNN